MRVPLVVLFACACGRIAFSPTPAADAAASCAGRELCDGFEDDDFEAPWTVPAGATLDSSIAHRGVHSAHFSSPALAGGQGGNWMLAESATVARGDPTMYVRAWVRLGALPSGMNEMRLGDLKQTASPFYGDVLFVLAQNMALYEQWTDMATLTTTAPPVGTWFCALWSVQRNPAAGMQVLGGDAPAAILAGLPSDGAPPVSELELGIAFSSNNVYGPQPALDVWIDDVIVDGAPITCAD